MFTARVSEGLFILRFTGTDEGLFTAWVGEGLFTRRLRGWFAGMGRGLVCWDG